MRLSFLAAGVLASAIGAAPLAWGAPGQVRKVTNFKSYQTYVTSSFCDTAGYCSYFFITVFDDASGVAQGYVVLQTFTQSGALLTEISCQGPAYANVIFDINMGTRTAKVNATVNPASPDCFSFNASTVTFSLTAAQDGSYHYSNVGSATSETPDSAYTMKTHYEDHGAKLTGSITGYPMTSFSGSLYDSRNTNIVKTR